MDPQQRHAILSSLTGHLISSSEAQAAALQQLDQTLSRSLIADDLKQVKTSQFAYEAADLFSPEHIPASRAAALEASAAGALEPQYRVFAREVPVRSTQLHASVPPWAAGAAVDRTIGPLINKDGRQFWFDFFRIEKLVALYERDQADPMLLFKINNGVRVIDARLPLAAELLPAYRLPAGSIWIRSQLLATDALAGDYTGLTIQGGRISLSAPPQTVNGKLTVAPNTTVTVQLELQQPAVSDADPTSPYGPDARAALLQLPQRFDFHFSGQGCALDEVSSASWNVYGQAANFEWLKQGQPAYDATLHRVLIPMRCSAAEFQVADCQSPFGTLRGRAPIVSGAWALPAGPIDILHPTPAAGIGGLEARCGSGLNCAWSGLHGGVLELQQPYILADPGRLGLTDLAASNHFAQQTLDLWRDAQNPFGTRVQLQYGSATPFFYNTVANGNEALMTLANADFQIDRPVTVAGQPPRIRSKNSLLFLAASKVLKLAYLFDDNILLDSASAAQNKYNLSRPLALALHNALFKVTPVNGCLLAGQLADDFQKVERGFVFLTFGLLAYLPTLPDPYAANIGSLKFQLRASQESRLLSAQGGQTIWMWLVCQVQWQPAAETLDAAAVSFHFAPLQNPYQVPAAPDQPGQATRAANRQASACDVLEIPREPAAIQRFDEAAREQPPGEALFQTPMVMAATSLPDYESLWNKDLQCLQQDLFALLDVSTQADLFGVSFSGLGGERFVAERTYAVAPASAAFPLQVEGMDVVSQGKNVRAFTVPQISWEPVLNTAPHVLPGDPPGYSLYSPPRLVPNYYPDDGGPTRLYTNSVQLVPLAPIPVTRMIESEFHTEPLNITTSLFTLPFGMRALAVLSKFVYPAQPPDIRSNRPKFANDLRGGRQLQFSAGKLPTDDYPMFNGGTLQINNVLRPDGSEAYASTLGQSVSIIFNDEFRPKVSPSLLISRGVPLTRIDFSGYGASIFSNWFNPLAQMAQTSQSKFDVWVGRTAHEVIQVRSIIYPWGIHVVRTIILYRASTGFVYRVDTGWKAESDGVFDFSYYMKAGGVLTGHFPDYQIHPGLLHGVFGVKNIVEADNQFKTTTFVHPNEYYLDDNNFVLQNTGTSDLPMEALLQMVFFDADVEIEDVVQGQVNGRLPSKKIMGFVQLAPRGIPLSKEALQALLSYQPTPIGGPLDGVLDIGRNGQKMRLDRFDMNNSAGANGSDIVFAAAVRGSVVLPKDGAWSLVQHQRSTGDVTPLPTQLAVPLIRVGALTYQVVNSGPSAQKVLLKPDPAAAQRLLRIANPADLLRPPFADTLNYGYLHSTDTQKALFLTPSYRPLAGAPAGTVPALLSKTPPLFADAVRIVNSKGIFPNIGDAASNFGDAINLLANGNEFAPSGLTDGGAPARLLMQINKEVAGATAEGYKLLKKVADFDLPSTAWTLVELGSAFKIYLEYKADNVKKPGGGTKNVTGQLNYDVDSFSGAVNDRWKSLMSGVGLVVDLGPIKRLVTIKGNWDAQNGSEAAYKGSTSDPDFPSPQLEFSKELQPVIDILEILQDLQGENYKDALQKGLKLAMSNKAGTWEYKLEASKEIPVLRFPMPDFLYNDPNAPLKLEAGLKLGAYFNAALKVTTDPKQLLPTAGAYLGFYGRLSVMCVSLSIATIYAVGQVNLDIGANTAAGPTLHMKFGFGAQIVVGLPVVGNVSVLYMVGVEIYTDATKLIVSAFLLFQGHAELLGGLVSVTITIEAKGTVQRENDRTDLAAQVTFGLDISIFLVIDISFSTSWQEQRQIA
jgi:hypothetical protein